MASERYEVRRYDVADPDEVGDRAVGIYSVWDTQDGSSPVCSDMVSGDARAYAAFLNAAAGVEPGRVVDEWPALRAAFVDAHAILCSLTSRELSADLQRHVQDVRHQMHAILARLSPAPAEGEVAS